MEVSLLTVSNSHSPKNHICRVAMTVYKANVLSVHLAKSAFKSCLNITAIMQSRVRPRFSALTPRISSTVNELRGYAYEACLYMHAGNVCTYIYISDRFHQLFCIASLAALLNAVCINIKRI